MSTTQPPVQVRSQGKSGLSSSTIVKLVVGGLIALILLIFVLQNTDRVEWSFLFWSFSLNQWVMLVVTLLIGVLIGMLVSTLLRRRRRQDLRRRANAV